jgi:tight adherence protein B
VTKFSRLPRFPRFRGPVAGRLISLGGAIAAGGLTRSSAGGLVVGVLLLAGFAGRRGRNRRREGAAERDAVLDLLTGLGLELRGGRPPAAALLAAAGRPGTVARPVLGPVLLAAGRGDDVSRPLLRAADPGLRALGAAWAVSMRTGAPLAGVVESLALGLRADRSLARERDAAMAGPRASAALLAVLPGVGIPLAAGLGAHPIAFLLHGRAGQGCLVAGVGLDLLSFVWTRHLTGSG